MSQDEHLTELDFGLFWKVGGVITLSDWRSMTPEERGACLTAAQKLTLADELAAADAMSAPHDAGSPGDVEQAGPPEAATPDVIPGMRRPSEGA